MIPIRDTIPARRTAWVVRLILLANVVTGVIEVAQGSAVEAWLSRFGVVPAAWAIDGSGAFLKWPRLSLTLLTSQFLHGGMFHLGANMLYLWIFGDNVEDRLGHGWFAGLYLGSGVIAALTQLAIQPQSTVPMIGASGAIAGVLGAYFLFFPFAKIVTLIPAFCIWEFVELPAFVFLGLWFLLQWLSGVTTIGQMAETGSVAWWAHIGGFVGGMGMAAAYRIRRRYA